MKIGCARHCLSPKQDPFYLIGFRSPNRMEPSSGIHDDIYCNSLLFEQDGKRLFLFSADFLEFEEPMAEDVKTLMLNKYGLERDCLLLAATHNHSSVVGYHKGWYTGKYDQRYYDFLIDTICRSYEECAANLRDATAKIGRKVITGYYGNRNHPGQMADNEVAVVKFFDESGTAFAGFVNWAVHSTVISADNTWLTAEWAGNVSKKLGDVFGFYPAMVVGAAGDCSNRNERQGKDFVELERVSAGMAEEIAAIPVEQDVELNRLTVQTLFHTVHDNGFHLDAKAWVISLGGLQIFVFPGELGSAFGIQMKQNCPVEAVVCGYTNGYYEYFLPAAEYGLSFETKDSPVPRGEPEKLIQKYIQVSNSI
ncbi:MAG: neutral/alkaline non-lysosomal ceramidase N-terminal domain-containing protein [Clostridiales bacterium]|nr:neutral/alkaline non-lysosomal ceramidase N-terminal domain-containing protein [Clostridiales bacterium]